MAKIETAAAVDAADAILHVADAIMVARGDLGPAIQFIRLPEAQEDLVAAAAQGRQDRGRGDTGAGVLCRSGRAAAIRASPACRCWPSKLPTR